MKVAAEVTAPPPVVSEIVPVVAPAGTRTRIDEAESAVIEVTGRPAKATAVAAPTFDPLIVTRSPLVPAGGVKPEIVGSAALRPTLKFVALPPLPSTLTTVSGPVAAPAGIPRISVPSLTA